MTERPTSTVRTAHAQDEPAIYELAAEMATSFVVERESFRRSFVAVLESDTALLLASETGGAVTGYVLGFVHSTFYANGRVAAVEEIAVAQELRRQHIGTMLMTEFEHRSLDMGVGVVSLATRRAGDFYSSIGYDESAAYYRKIL